jgi:hypothetical protein
MILYLSGIVLIIAAYYIGQYKGYIIAKNKFYLPHGEAPKVSTNEGKEECCDKCGMIKHPVLGAKCLDKDCPGTK